MFAPGDLYIVNELNNGAKNQEISLTTCTGEFANAAVICLHGYASLIWQVKNSRICVDSLRREISTLIELKAPKG
jgi:hypothetical protein